MKDKILNEVRELVDKYPNNMELGKKVRQFIRNKDDVKKIEQFNRNRSLTDRVSTIEELENRIKDITEEGWSGEL